MEKDALSGARFKKAGGRIALSLFMARVGGDLQAIISGGDAHIGATALASGGKVSVMEAEGHREGEIAAKAAAALASALGARAAVSCGIHFDCITCAEIKLTEALADDLIEEAARFLRENS